MLLISSVCFSSFISSFSLLPAQSLGNLTLCMNQWVWAPLPSSLLLNSTNERQQKEATVWEESENCSLLSWSVLVMAQRLCKMLSITGFSGFQQTASPYLALLAKIGTRILMFLAQVCFTIHR